MTGSVSCPGIGARSASTNAISVCVIGILSRIGGAGPHAHLSMSVSVFRMGYIASGDTYKYVGVGPESKWTFLDTGATD